MAIPSLDYIHRFLPAAAGGSRPTLLLLHSTGGDENQLLDLGARLAPGAALLSPRGKILENGNSRFFRRLAEGVFDLDDLKRRTYELADFVQAASQTYGFDPQAVTAVGYSNGANIAASMLLLRPQSLAGAVLFHAMVPLQPEFTPSLHGREIFISAGQFDPMVPAEDTQRLADMLQGAGATVTLQWRPGGHMLTPDEVTAAAEWLPRTALLRPGPES